MVSMKPHWTSSSYMYKAVWARFGLPNVVFLFYSVLRYCAIAKYKYDTKTPIMSLPLSRA